MFPCYHATGATNIRCTKIYYLCNDELQGKFGDEGALFEDSGATRPSGCEGERPSPGNSRRKLKKGGHCGKITHVTFFLRGGCGESGLKPHEQSNGGFIGRSGLPADARRKHHVPTMIQQVQGMSS